jgi:hypothetical protein
MWTPSCRIERLRAYVDALSTHFEWITLLSPGPSSPSAIVAFEICFESSRCYESLFSKADRHEMLRYTSLFFLYRKNVYTCLCACVWLSEHVKYVFFVAFCTNIFAVCVLAKAWSVCFGKCTTQHTNSQKIVNTKTKYMNTCMHTYIWKLLFFKVKFCPELCSLDEMRQKVLFRDACASWFDSRDCLCSYCTWACGSNPWSHQDVFQMARGQICLFRKMYYAVAEDLVWVGGGAEDWPQSPRLLSPVTFLCNGSWALFFNFVPEGCPKNTIGCRMWA